MHKATSWDTIGKKFDDNSSLVASDRSSEEKGSGSEKLAKRKSRKKESIGERKRSGPLPAHMIRLTSDISDISGYDTDNSDTTVTSPKSAIRPI